MSDIENERRKLRFLGKIKVMPSGCWEWQAGMIKKEYGKPYGMFFWGVIEGRELNMQAHRAAYQIFKGNLPKYRKTDGCVLHKCNNPPCVNPDHLYIGTHLENARDREEAGHTSRGEHRYNYKRSGKLIQRIKAEFAKGGTVADVCDRLGIGRSTMYRAAKQDADVRAAMDSVKTENYRQAAFRRNEE